MTDPVDTDALRNPPWSNLDVVGSLLDTAADELDRLRADVAMFRRIGGRLRASIEDAPHDHGLRAWCQAGFSDEPCTCWKANAL